MYISIYKAVIYKLTHLLSPCKKNFSRAYLVLSPSRVDASLEFCFFLPLFPFSRPLRDIYYLLLAILYIKEEDAHISDNVIFLDNTVINKLSAL